MESNIQILDINKKILETFDNEYNKLDYYKDQLKLIEDTLNKKNENKIENYSIIINLQNIHDRLVKKIDNINSEKQKKFYIMETVELIDKYKKIIEKPLVVSFMSNKNVNNKEKQEIIKHFLEKANKYNIIEYQKQKELHDTDKKCEICNTDNFIDLDGFNVCVNCGNEIEIPASLSSYKDSDRVNVGSKYTYDKRSHFRDCINQFQGKQNSSVSDEVYKDLEREFKAHGLLIDSDKKHTKFKNITKDHILLFLKETGHSKNYEDAILIHYNLTGVKPPDISHLEKNITDDFNEMVKVYERKFKYDKNNSRKNFINNQYVLYQLLVKYNYKCNPNDLNLLKTIERKNFHDDICCKIFKELGWNFKSLF